MVSLCFVSRFYFWKIIITLAVKMATDTKTTIIASRIQGGVLYFVDLHLN